MNQIFLKPPFPTSALPSKLRAAVDETIRVVKAPDALVVGSALASASLVVQGKHDVERYNNLVSPVSLNILSFADSGERKTTLDNLFFQVFRDFEASEGMRFTEAVAEDGEQLDPDKSEKMPEFRMLYSDITPAALIARLEKNSHSFGLIEDEAGRFFTGRMTDDLGLLNKAWNGSELIFDRKHESIRIRSPRCTLNLMVQPSVFLKFMQRKGDEARGIGFLARSLVAYPLSTQGWRFLGEDLEALPAIEVFRKRITELLDEQIDFLYPFASTKNKARTILTFQPQAQAAWRDTYNLIEQNLQPGGAFCQAKDYASKVAENIARLAAIFHVFEGYEGTQISLETLQSATTVALWYAQEFVSLFAPPDLLDELQRDASELDMWLKNYVRARGMPNGFCLDKSFLLQYGPNSLRRRDRMQFALESLAAQQKLRLHVITAPNGKHRKMVVELFANAYLSQPQTYLSGFEMF